MAARLPLSATVVAWDFDGVLNRNVADGQFLWAKDFEADLRQSLLMFNRHVFDANFGDVITGREDLRDRVESWAKAVGFAGGPDALLAYWFAKDSFPDPSMLEIIKALSGHGVRQVIATNNESRRASYIENEMGYAALVEHVFSSGRMGVRKPDPAFFTLVAERLDAEPHDMLLIDDAKENVDQAARHGWRSIHFTGGAADSLGRQLFKMLGIG
jgi:putative hydrolase of the HAD superfamily